MVKAYFLSLREDTPKRGYWDYSLLEDIFDRLNIEKVEVNSIPAIKRPNTFGIVVIPARSHFKLVDKINEELSKLSSVVLFVMGDEQNAFPVEKIKHQDIRIWVQNPQPGRHDEYGKIGCGYTPHIRDYGDVPEKDLDWFFSGQGTNPRRKECIESLKDVDGGKLIETDGFAKGLDQKEYVLSMARAKLAPCPSGPHTVDTFRLFEALELGTVPIADEVSPNKDMAGFWDWLFGDETPFIKISDYSSINGYIKDNLNLYPYLNNDVFAWWLGYKTYLTKAIAKEIYGLTGIKLLSDVTVVVPISPIPSHPETHILEETVNSIRHHYKDAEIILSFDGVRQEQELMTRDYCDHIYRILHKSRFWGNVTPLIFTQHKHQSGMLKDIIDNIDTPMILYVEQDTPLVVDEPIDFGKIEKKVLSGSSNLVRLYHEGKIPKEHYSLMLFPAEDEFLKTYQWSQRPHLASRAFYRRILSEQFSDKANCFIEDLIHGKLQESFKVDGELGWEQWRVHIYYPQGNNLKRSYHTNGRGSQKKYDENQVW